MPAVRRLTIAKVNLPVAGLIWAMIIPMLLKIDFGALTQVRAQRGGVLVTLSVNWGIKPFSMALFGWLFIRHVFAPWLAPDQANGYIAGLIRWRRRPALPWCSCGVT